MALTDQQKVDVIFYLGWPATALDSTSVNYNSELVRKLTLNSTPIESRVVQLLGKLKEMDLRLDGASDRASALEADDIKLNPDEIMRLKQERRRIVKELARFLNVPMMGGSSVNVDLCV